jgi:hypothetical protein
MSRCQSGTDAKLAGKLKAMGLVPNMGCFPLSGYDRGEGVGHGYPDHSLHCLPSVSNIRRCRSDWSFARLPWRHRRSWLSQWRCSSQPLRPVDPFPFYHRSQRIRVSEKRFLAGIVYQYNRLAIVGSTYILRRLMPWESMPKRSDRIRTSVMMALSCFVESKSSESTSSQNCS